MILALLLACSGSTDDTGDTALVAAECEDAPDVTWVSFGDGFFATYCRACHSEDTQDRFGAPEMVNFDTLDDIRTYEASIRRSVIEQGTMPVGGGIYDDDLVLLGYLLDCGL